MAENRISGNCMFFSFVRFGFGFIFGRGFAAAAALLDGTVVVAGIRGGLPMSGGKHALT